MRPTVSNGTDRDRGVTVPANPLHGLRVLYPADVIPATLKTVVFGFLIGSIFLIPAILIAVPVHELGHGVAAYFAGDPSPRNRGYLSYKPKLFINVYGVLLALLANVSFGTPGAGVCARRGTAAAAPSHRQQATRRMICADTRSPRC